VESRFPIHGWHIQIREPHPPFLLFSEWHGDGCPSEEEIIWDGLSATGELVQSATDYHFGISIVDIFGNTAETRGTISIDVLVHREEGDVLRVIVPSIVFAPNTGEFIEGLNSEISANNAFILNRIAEVLQRFDTYRVKVEGHANPTTPPNTRARTDEERGTRREIGLQPLSEERARAVMRYLISRGVEAERLSAVGMGGTRTVADFTDRDNWWKNRRVEFILER